MKYLLVNHVPLGNGSAGGRYQVGDLFLEDLRAQAKAIRAIGGELIVATPCVPQLNAMAGGSFNSIEIVPEENGFSYIPLPRYQSLRQFLQVRKSLLSILRYIIAASDIVQMDYGGHPFMLGQVAWPIATALKRKRIWIFDGADPFPRLELLASHESNFVKRFAKQLATRRKIQFCRWAIQHADLVFAHNAAVVERFKSVWNERCHAFDRSFVTDEMILKDVESQKAHLREGNRPFRLLCAGRQIRIKGTDHAIRAVAQLRAMNIPVELNVMGDGDDLPEFKKLAEELNVSDVVRFTGTVPYGEQLFAEWNKADLMLVTNLTAEISRNVLLSLARGLPLLTYENPGTDALLREADAAVIVEKGNVEAIVSAVAALAKDRGRLVKLMSKGLELAKIKTLDQTHRHRAELVRELFNNKTRSQ